MHIKSTYKFKQYNEDLRVTRKLPIGIIHSDNIRRITYFVRDCIVVAGAITTFLTWLGILLLMSGDVHPNPGQTSTSSNSSTSSTSNDSFSFLNTLNLSKHLSFVQYNVQSIVHKLDILSTKLSDFDILAFFQKHGYTQTYRWQTCLYQTSKHRNVRTGQQIAMVV